jgi:hypothetical protein
MLSKVETAKGKAIICNHEVDFGAHTAYAKFQEHHLKFTKHH